MILDSLFPVFVLLVLGHLLQRYQLTPPIFLNTADRLVYFIFFPAMLFWKIGGAAAEVTIDWPFCLAAIAALLTIFILSTVFMAIFKVAPFSAGAFSQSCYRFNTYIGMAVVLTALGEEGVRQFGLLVGIVIPLLNVLAVSTLIWFSGEAYPWGQRLSMTFKALFSNPLILACAAGVAYARWFEGFPLFIDNTLRLASMVTLPLALLSIGAALTLSKLKGHLPLALWAAGFKLILLPLIGWCFLRLFQVEGMPFKVGMIFFALPTSTAIYVLCAQLSSDTELASAAIVVSTLLSFFSLSVALTL